MEGKFKKGKQIQTINGKTVVVEEWLAEGGQGDIYRILYGGEEKALKWYRLGKMGKTPKAFYENLKNNVLKGAPSDAFLWPLDITSWEENSFGYIMDLRPEEYHEMTEFMLAKVRFKSYRIAVDAALNIVNAYRILHNQGYSYQDLNDGNFFINPENGKVLICDNDNVAPDNVETGMLGKPRYMAPEIVKGKGKIKPNYYSDLFSMSVIIFILFCLNHPLEGKRFLVPALTPARQEVLYGTKPLFIMDEDDKSNGPDPVIHRNSILVWECLPGYMKDIFLKAFSQTAMEKPGTRPREKDWLDVLVRFRNDIVRCRCGNDVFVSEEGPCTCEKCGKKLHIPYRLQFDSYSIPAFPGNRIYRVQLGICDEAKALACIAGMGVSKKDPSILRLVNLSSKSWNVTNREGKLVKIRPQEAIRIKDGINLEISTEIGTETVKIIRNDAAK